MPKNEDNSLLSDAQVRRFVERADRGEISQQEMCQVMSEHQVSPLRLRRLMREIDWWDSFLQISVLAGSLLAVAVAICALVVSLLR